MAKEKEKKKAYLAMAAAFACVLSAGLLLLLAALLLFGGNKDQEALTADSEGASVRDEGLPEDGEEDPQADLEPEEEGVSTELLKPKEVEGETDDITLGVDVSKFQETIDWEQVAAAGVDFAMVQIGRAHV